VPQSPLIQEMARFNVTLKMPDGEERVIEVGAAEHVLEAALNAGLDLPYSCLQGWCLTCAARLVRGEVDQTDSKRYYAADRRAGFVLPCTARPRSDLFLVTYARDAMRKARRQHGLPFPQGDWGEQRP
jgi:ferredoxin